MNYNKKYTIFKNKISKKTGKSLEFTGTLKEIANRYNLSYNILYNRITKMHLSIEESINSKDNRSNKTYTAFKGIYNNDNGLNEFTGNLYQISKHFNIPYNTLKSRLNKQNLTIDKAVLKSFK